MRTTHDRNRLAPLAVAAAAFAIVSSPALGAPPEPNRPANGTYRYDILAKGTRIAQSDITISSDQSAISVDEQLSQGPTRITTSARYARVDLGLLSYSALVGAQETRIAVKPRLFTVTVPGQHVDIAADPTTSLMVVSDNFIGTQIMIPALLHASRATAFTAAVLRGGTALVATVVPGPSPTRPSNVPEIDRAVEIAVAGLHETFWFDPTTYVVDDIRIAEQSVEIHRTSAVGLTATPAPAPTPIPTAAAHFRSDEVAFTSADGTKLAGTVTIPEGSSQRRPAVVFVHGSGAVDRNETIGPNSIFLQLSNALSNAGYIVLRYDKRGVGASGGTREGTRDDLLADATAALAFIGKRNDVDPRHLFMLGHSEGGELVPTVAAANASLAGIVLMAPPALPLWQVSMQQALASVPHEQSARTEKAELDTFAAIRDGSKTGPGMAWYRSSMDIDPIVDIARVPCPILVLQGAADVQVLPANLPRLVNAATAAGRTISAKIFPDDNHLFMKITPGEPRTPAAALDQYLHVPGIVDADVLATLIDWLKKR